MDKRILAGIFIVLLLFPLGNILPTAAALSGVGGTVSYYGGKEIHKFTTSGTFNVTGTGFVEVLVVGGGGGTGGVGAQSYKGAGGAGGLYYNASFPVTTGSYTVTIGAGGAPNANGGNSVFGSITATGGGKGGDCTIGGATPPNIAPGAGGSGGGGGHNPAEACGSPGGTGTAGQGKNGGAGSAAGGVASGGGGGGAGTAGAAGAGSGGAGAGGNGLAYNFNGTSYYYAGGGGGGGENNGIGAAGGLGGGGNGAKYIGASAAQNGATNRGGGAGGGGGAASGGSGVVIVVINRPDAVTTLTSTDIGTDFVDLSWTAPNLNGLTCQGYQINYTSPFGDPVTVLVNNTGLCTTTYTVSGLALFTDYSFRVMVWTPSGGNVTHANIYNVTTLAFNEANYTIGSFDFQANNPVLFPIRYERDDVNSTMTLVNVQYDNTISLACDLSYTYAGTNRTYHGLAGSPISATEDETTFTFINATNEITTFHCWNENGNQTANYVLTQTDFLLLQQIRDFRNGTFGTQGQLGAFDFITLIVVIISMIGLNRTNEAVGGFFCIIAISVLAFFGIIQWYIALIAGLAVIIMLAMAATRKD